MSRLIYTAVLVLISVNGISSYSTWIQNRTSTRILENGNISFICFSNKPDKQTMFWIKSGLSSPMKITNDSCQPSGGFLLTNGNLYEHECLQNGTISLSLKAVSGERNGEIWSCRFDFISSNNTKIIEVQVPVKSANIEYEREVVTIQENTSLSIECKSSPSRPPSYVYWFIQSINSQDDRINITEMSKSIEEKDDTKNLTVSASVLAYKPNRFVNNWILYCLASNVEDQNKTSEEKTLNIIYLPEGPPFILGFPKQLFLNLSIIEKDQCHFSCNVVGGNPHPMLSWRCVNVGAYNVSSEKLENVTKELNVTWIAARNQTSCSCLSQHIFANQTVTVSLNVQYPPSTPSIRISNGNTDEVADAVQFNIIETESIEMSCYSNSKPIPTYTWIMNKLKIAEHRKVTLANIRRTDAGNYTCRVYNLMHRTFGDSDAGTHSSSTLVNVLYPPDVGPLTNISLNEESTLNITCPIRQGNPQITSVFWSRKNDDKRWNSKQLIILNVSREDDTVYRCTVFNEMLPTFGSDIKKKVSGEFHLNIFFSAVISNFSVLEKEYKETTVVNETEKVSLSCTAEANPASDMGIRSPTHELIATASNTNTVRHALRNVSYGNAGQYICTGRNNYTDDIPSISTLILIVRCPPRPSSETNNDGNVTTTMHADVTLRFTAHDFLDEPNKTVFTWFKDNASIEGNISKNAISSYGLQSNLSIRNVTETDFGQYRVRVTNSVGNYLHIFALQAKDKPDLPKDFSYIKDSITGSSVTLMWVPGFNGGYPQNFILLYKRITESNWQNKYIRDTGERHMNYTLLSLFSKSEYQVKMFARNEEGDSTYADILQFSTKEQTSVLTETDSGNTSGIVAGTLTSLIIVVIVVLVIGVYLYRKRSKQKESQKVYYDPQRNTTSEANESSLTYETLNESKRERDLYSQLPATYEQLDAASRERNAYSEIENTEHDMSDYVNMRI